MRGCSTQPARFSTLLLLSQGYRRPRIANVHAEFSSIARRYPGVVGQCRDRDLYTVRWPDRRGRRKGQERLLFQERLGLRLDAAGGNLSTRCSTTPSTGGSDGLSKDLFKMSAGTLGTLWTSGQLCRALRLGGTPTLHLLLNGGLRAELQAD